MVSCFEKEKAELYKKSEEILNSSEMFKSLRAGEKFDVDIPKEFEQEFFKLVDKVNLSLMEDKDNFYDFTIEDFFMVNYNPIKPQLKLELGI